MAVLITSVTPADRLGNATGAAVTSILEPAKYHWELIKEKAPSAGKMASGLDLQMLVGWSRSVNIIWTYKTFAEIATLFAAFMHEYVNVTFMDSVTGALKTAHMSTDGMSTDCYYAAAGGKDKAATVTCKQVTPDGV